MPPDAPTLDADSVLKLTEQMIVDTRRRIDELQVSRPNSLRIIETNREELARAREALGELPPNPANPA
jgi:hypothetical protein